MQIRAGTDADVNKVFAICPRNHVQMVRVPGGAGAMWALQITRLQVVWGTLGAVDNSLRLLAPSR